MEITVSVRGGAMFSSIGAAVKAVPLGASAVIFIKNGIYREKIYCEKDDISFVGESREGTLLVNGDGARHTHADGRPYGTFRSYTAFFSGGSVRVQNMTIANTAGEGSLHGQAVAAAVDARYASFNNVSLLGCQDTLFTGPLPERQRLPDGFLGPKQFAPRVNSFQWYQNCYIRGNIDFIFGGATALFEGCTLHCAPLPSGQSGYIAAPSTPPGQLGYLFYRCRIEAQAAAAHSFYLARPWRGSGAAAFVECSLCEAVRPEGFDNWSNAENEKTARFAEYGNTGAGAAGPRAFGKRFSAAQAAQMLSQARRACCR
ncbi:MAG: pectinesterase family protein [Oscillospiraceae bacterium]